MQIGLNEPSTNELYARAHLLATRVEHAAPLLTQTQPIDHGAYIGLRDLRRQVLASYDQLKHLAEQNLRPVFEEGKNVLFTPGVSQGKEFPGSFTPIIERLEKSPFVQNGGKAILDARPKDLPAIQRVMLRTLDLATKSAIYATRNPLKAASIGMGVLVAKLLFVYLCWEAISNSVKSLFGIAKKPAASPTTPAPTGPSI